MTKINFQNNKIRKFLTGFIPHLFCDKPFIFFNKKVRSKIKFGLQAHKKGEGFTLIEMLVALAIFSIVVTVMLSVTISLVKVQRKTQNLQLVHDSARYSIEMMAKEIRMSKIIDVKKSAGPHVEYTLKIQRLDSPGNDIVYHFYNDSSGKEGVLARDKGADSRDLNDKTKVDIRGYFYPESGTPGKRLTIVLRATSVGARLDEGATIDLQTTVISRDYGS